MSGNEVTQGDIDRFWMRQAIKCALKAEAEGEVPVGAVLVQGEAYLGLGWNQPIQGNDPSLHAEMVAIRQGALALKNYRLSDTTLYVTLEPCVMCAGLISHARIARLVFGAWDDKTGACGSVFNILEHPKQLRRVAVEGGIMATECREILQTFFRKRRKHAHTS